MKKMLIFSKESSNIFFHILTQCNLVCNHCYINQEEHGYFSLDINTIYSWLELFFYKTKNPNIIFLGGEPTIYPHLILAIRKAKKLGYGSIIVDTNGYNISGLLRDVNINEVDMFNFSLDGPTSDINDLLRGKGSYNICIKSIIDAKKKGFKVGLIFTVSRANFKYLKHMPSFLSFFSIDHFFIQVIGIRGRWSKNRNIRKKLAQVYKNSWIEAIYNTVKQTIEYGIRVTYPKVFLSSNEIFECAGMVADNYFVFPNGRVYKCPLCEDYPLHAQEIKNNILVNINGYTEMDLFELETFDGCVINKIIQPDNITYDDNENMEKRVACCMLKEEIIP